MLRAMLGPMNNDLLDLPMVDLHRVCPRARAAPASMGMNPR
jgi:hypothetical protein